MNPITRLRRHRWHLMERRAIKKNIVNASKKGKVKIIVGAGYTSYEGWIKTDFPFFDLLNPKHWKYFFSRNKVDNLLAEHVLEHLHPEQCEFVFEMASQNMKKGGCFRIAVPDGYHSDQKYIDYVKPGGNGPGADDHKILFNYQTLSKMVQRHGFEPNPVEYWKENGELISTNFNEGSGPIQRTRKNIEDKKINSLPFTYTSLVLDAIRK